MIHPPTKYARSGDVCIAYQVTGDGPYDVVYAPGTMSHLDMDWELPRLAVFLEQFSSMCRLVRFDKRGTGLSDRPVSMATLEERTDDIRAVMDAVGLERANLFGISEGGSMACMFAATYPHRVNSLVLWGCQAKWISCHDHPWGQNQEEHQAMLKMIHDDWPSIDYITGPGVGLGKGVDPVALENVVRYMRAAASPSAVYAYEQMNGDIDIRPILQSIRAPTLVMNRTCDPVASVDAARDIATRIPGAKFVEYAGNSHPIASSDTAKILADIQEFITGERPAEATDRILATVMFLDIVSSTEEATRLGDNA
jgi:pimeloyl-ACP methyl ester carboxylesterase